MREADPYRTFKLAAIALLAALTVWEIITLVAAVIQMVAMSAGYGLAFGLDYNLGAVFWDAVKAFGAAFLLKWAQTNWGHSQP